MNESEQTLFDKYINKFNLHSEVANTIARDKQLTSFYEECLAVFNSPVTLANIVTNEIARELKYKQISEFNAKQISQLAKMLDDETISNKIAKQVFDEMLKSGDNPIQIVEAKGLTQISNPEKIIPIIDEIIAKIQIMLVNLKQVIQNS